MADRRETLWTAEFLTVCSTGFLVFLSFYSLMGIPPLYLLHIERHLAAVG